MQTTSVRAVTLAVRTLAQEQVGAQLAAPVTDEEAARLALDLG